MNDPFSHLLPRVTPLQGTSPETALWEIGESIPQLAYLTHSYFRYYGKFPSTIASQLLTDYPAPPGAVLLDNFAGSGTSLVEASRRGVPSVGVDLNPLGVLAGRVKTAIYDPFALRFAVSDVLAAAEAMQVDVLDERLDSRRVEKWFGDEAARELQALSYAVEGYGDKEQGAFLALALLAIIRRVSRAYDGEVRPHINPRKAQRSPFEAYAKKVEEMIDIQWAFTSTYPDRAPAITILADATEDYTDRLPDGDYWLVISHPPYLNCFDYLPVFRPELDWARLLPSYVEPHEYASLRKSELHAWPANEETCAGYYESLAAAYRVVFDQQPPGGRCAVIIGDCTIKGKLEPAHQKVISLMGEIGYRTERVNYRSTHYGTGKYAYSHRADYHGDDAEKRDAIIVFKK